MFTKITYYTGILACIAMILSCFLPWVHINTINETFTGFRVTRFSTGNYYGRAGITITIMTSITLLLMIVPKIWAKRMNLFVAALLLAYTLRTYVIFTNSLFPGEVDKLIGIYMIVLLAFVILFATVFPKLNLKKEMRQEGENG